MSRLLRYSVLFLVTLVAAGCNTMQTTRSDSNLARIQERGSLILGTSGNMPTMSQADDQGRVSGFDIDMARLMAAR